MGAAACRKITEEKERLNHWLASRPDGTNPEETARFEKRKADYGLAHRANVTAFLHLVEADEWQM